LHKLTVSATGIPTDTVDTLRGAEYPCYKISQIKGCRVRKLLLVVLCGIVLGVMPAMAAASPTSGAYSGTGAQQLSQVQSASASQSPTNAANTSGTSGTLPFTGLNLGLLGGVAIALMGTGLVLRRRTRSTS
jgi:hypothetical protein